MKTLKDLTQEEVIALQEEANLEAGISDKTKLAIAMHDNLMVLAMMNDFIRLMNTVELNAARVYEVKDIRLTKSEKEQREGANKFRRTVISLLDKQRDDCIDIIHEMEKEVKRGSD